MDKVHSSYDFSVKHDKQKTNSLRQVFRLRNIQHPRKSKIYLSNLLRHAPSAFKKKNDNNDNTNK